MWLDPLTNTWQAYRMTEDDREPLSRFTRSNTAEELVRWAKAVRYFYVFADYESGHVSMSAELLCRIRFSSSDDFLAKITQLVDLEPTPAELPWSRSPISFMPEYLVPGECQIRNCPIDGSFCYISVGDGFFEIKLYGDGVNERQGIHEKTVTAAQKIENHIDKLRLAGAVDHSIADHFNCISAKNYPVEFGVQN
jgi:hypothetical protein